MAALKIGHGAGRTRPQTGGHTGWRRSELFPADGRGRSGHDPRSRYGARGIPALRIPVRKASGRHRRRLGTRRFQYSDERDVRGSGHPIGPECEGGASERRSAALVRFVLQGSVMASGRRLRIACQLADAKTDSQFEPRSGSQECRGVASGGVAPFVFANVCTPTWSAAQRRLAAGHSVPKQPRRARIP